VSIPLDPPNSPDAEASVVGQMLARPSVVGEVIGTSLQPQHFYHPALRALFHEIVAAYYADDPIDALVIGEHASKQLAKLWRCDEPEAVQKVQELAAKQRIAAGRAPEHAALIKRDADYRALLDLAHSTMELVATEDKAPDEVAALVSQNAMQIATQTLQTNEIISFDELGGRIVQQMRREMAARAQGLELGAYFGLKFLDFHLRGLRPTELLILAGEPGAGKSAVSWIASQRFAERQMQKPADRRVGTFICSLEMGEEPSNVRVVQQNTGIDGGAVREGKTDEDDLRKVIQTWKAKAGLPLYFNFTSTLRASQLRALIVEAIRRHNIGLVVIDHMRYFDMDGRYGSQTEEEEAKARFLKEDIAKALNVAVIVLAHTTKAIENREDRRPRLSDLRGSGQVAAHADFVGFVHRPYNAASQADKDDGLVKRTEAELIWSKARHAPDTIAPFHFDPSVMEVR
jgi:replicative DNA helicase